jgi:glycosyltransferase involved in cell wall biosynthesis
MRILFVVHQFLPRYFTGTEQYVHALGVALVRAGHAVEVFTLEPNFAEADRLFEERLESIDGLAVTRLRVWYHLDADYDRMAWSHPLVGQRFAARLAAARPDVVHVFHLHHLGIEVLLAARAARLPVALHLMDFWFLCPNATLRRADGSLCSGPPQAGVGCIDCHRPELAARLSALGVREELIAFAAHAVPTPPAFRATLEACAGFVHRPRALRAAMATVDRVFAPSKFLAETFVADGFPRERFEVMAYGVDLDALFPLRAARDTESAVLRCAFLGSIAEHKGVDLAVDAVLATEGPIELTVHGRTSDFPDFAAPLVARAAGDPRIRFVGPFHPSERAAVLATIDVLFVPSRWYENTPFVILEAMAAGIVVIASDLGGIAEIVAHEVNGELAAVGDRDAFARALARLAFDRVRLARYRAALPTPKSLEFNARELAAVYRAMLAAGESR